MRKVERIVWHTAAHGRDGQAFDATAAQIDQWHRERGWSEIGYNVVIRFSGAIEQGRDPRKIPAGVAGINETTYHICFSGHGDIAPLTPQQLESGVHANDWTTCWGCWASPCALQTPSGIATGSCIASDSGSDASSDSKRNSVSKCLKMSQQGEQVSCGR